MNAIIKGILWPHTRRVSKWMSISIVGFLALGIVLQLAYIATGELDSEIYFYDITAGFGYAMLILTIVLGSLLMLCVDSSPQDTRLRFPTFYYLLPQRFNTLFCCVFFWRIFTMSLFTGLLMVIGEVLYKPLMSGEPDISLYHSIKDAGYISLTIIFVYTAAQGIAWATSAIRFDGIAIVLSIVFIFSVLILALYFTNEIDTNGIEYVVAASGGVLVTTTMLGYVGARMQRSKTIINDYLPQFSYQLGKGANDFNYRSFNSDLTAQIWYEFRRGYCYLPLSTFVIIPAVIYLVDSIGASGVVGIVFLGAVAFVLGFFMDRKTRIYSNFALLHPCSTKTLTQARILAALLAIVSSVLVIVIFSIPFGYDLHDAFPFIGSNSAAPYQWLGTIAGILFNCVILLGILLGGRVALIGLIGIWLGTILGFGIIEILRNQGIPEMEPSLIRSLIFGCLILVCTGVTPFLSMKKETTQLKFTVFNVLNCLPLLLSIGLLLAVSQQSMGRNNNLHDMSFACIPFLIGFVMVYYVLRSRAVQNFDIYAPLMISIGVIIVLGISVLTLNSQWLGDQGHQVTREMVLFAFIGGGMTFIALLSTPILIQWQRHS